MGVVGLKAYVNKHSQLGTPFSWLSTATTPPIVTTTDTIIATNVAATVTNATETTNQNTPTSRHVVIDGNGIAYTLYFRHHSFIMGGDYNQFAVTIKEFIGNLINCGCHVHILMDGISPSTKWKERLSRARTRIDNSIEIINGLKRNHPESLAPDHYSQKGILPPWALVVFVQTVKNMEEREERISMRVAVGEADAEIGALSKQLEGYVIGNDSDFYIYDIPQGYIPLNELNVSATGVTGKIYQAKTLCEHLHIPQAFLPIYGTLCGTDYVDDDITSKFHTRAIQLYPPNSRRTRAFISNISIGKFLSNHTNVANVLDTAVKMMPEKDQLKALEMWGQSIGHYTLKEIYDSARELDDCYKQVLCSQAVGVYPLHVSPLSLPAPYPSLFLSGDLNPKAMEVMCRGLFFADPTLEDSTRPSAWECTDSLRKEMVGLCIDGALYHVYGRVQGHIGRKAEQSIRQKVALDGISTMSPDQRMAMLIQWLDLDQQDPSWIGWGSDTSLPSLGLALPALTLRLLIRHNDVPIRRSQAIALANALFCTSCATSEIERQSEPSMPKIAHIHLISQWQLALFVVSIANQILLCPFIDIDPCTILDGPTMHYYLRKAMKSKGIYGMPLCKCREDGKKVEIFTALLHVVIGGLDPFLAAETPRVNKKANSSGVTRDGKEREKREREKESLFAFLADMN